MTITNYSMFSIPKERYTITLNFLERLWSGNWKTDDRASSQRHLYPLSDGQATEKCFGNLFCFAVNVSISVITIALNLVYAVAAFIIFAIPDGIKYLSKPDEGHIATGAMPAPQQV